MLTSRGWSILVCIFLMLAVGMLDRYIVSSIPNTALELLGLTLGAWFCIEWLMFAIRARVMSRRLQVGRTLLDDRGPVDTLWARQTFTVEATLRLPAGLRIPYVKVDDLPPFGAEVRDGGTVYDGPVEVGQPVTLRYRLRCAGIGRVRFEGLRVQLADWQGFFYHVTFLPDPRTYRVLPPLADIDGNSPTVKRHNLLPPPGVHRLRRPGSGSELLDLRDYLPGDPPKTIAWKVSARRDRLITKEFETEVPVRCTLLVDTSNSVRVGPPSRTPLIQLVEIAACVSQAASGTRDLIGLCLFDEQRVHAYTRPARGPRHLVQLIGTLAEAAGVAPGVGEASMQTLLPIAHGFAREVYPDLLRADVNHFPEWLGWLQPPPAYTLKAPTFADRVYQWLPVLLGTYGLAALGLMTFGWSVLASMLLRPSFSPPERFLMASIFALLSLLMVVTALRIPMMLFPVRRRQYRWRKQLAALLAVQHGLGPGGLGVLLEDEEHFTRHLQRFLAEHQVPFPVRRYDDRGRSLLADPRKVETLADALLQAVRKGHDNELYVILADVLEVGQHLDPLVRAVKVAVARHHRVMVICPVEGEVASPNADFQELKRTFARMSVPVIPAREGESVRLILNRLDRLRLAGTFRGGRR